MASLAGINFEAETTRMILRGGILGSILAVMPPTDNFRFMVGLLCNLSVIVEDVEGLVLPDRNIDL